MTTVMESAVTGAVHTVKSRLAASSIDPSLRILNSLCWLKFNLIVLELQYQFPGMRHMGNGADETD